MGIQPLDTRGEVSTLQRDWFSTSSTEWVCCNMEHIKGMLHQRDNYTTSAAAMSANWAGVASQPPDNTVRDEVSGTYYRSPF